MLRDSLSELRWRICRDARDWQREVTERPLDVAQSGWIAKYNRTLFDVEQSSNRGASRHRSARRGHHPSALGRVARRCERCLIVTDNIWDIAKEAGSLSNARDIVAPAAPRGRCNCDQEHDYAYRGDLGPSQSGPQSSGHYQPRQSPVEGRHGGTVGLTAQDDVAVAVNRVLDAQLRAERTEDVAWGAERTTEQLRQSNRELLARLRSLATRVLGSAQAAARPCQRVPGSDGLMARQARREA
ncbi:hypothetical protein PHMEG_00022226, partial [Phytophthora megakarya]